jgi:hypothetical protein
MYRVLWNSKLLRKRKDCEAIGNRHEWYNIDGVTSGCYHCEIVREGQLWKTSAS